MSLTIIEDTRQQAGKHNAENEYFSAHGIKVIRSKLPVGDYANILNMSVVVDTKKDIQELAGDCIQQHDRFRTELITAQECGIRLIILTQDDSVRSVDDLPRWYNWRRKKNPRAITGKQLYKIVKTMSEKYGAEFAFCTKNEVGERIVQYLTQ